MNREEFLEKLNALAAQDFEKLFTKEENRNLVQELENSEFAHVAKDCVELIRMSYLLKLLYSDERFAITFPTLLLKNLTRLASKDENRFAKHLQNLKVADLEDFVDVKNNLRIVRCGFNRHLAFVIIRTEGDSTLVDYVDGNCLFSEGVIKKGFGVSTFEAKKGLSSDNLAKYFKSLKDEEQMSKIDERFISFNQDGQLVILQQHCETTKQKRGNCGEKSLLLLTRRLGELGFKLESEEEKEKWHQECKQGKRDIIFAAAQKIQDIGNKLPEFLKEIADQFLENICQNALRKLESSEFKSESFLFAERLVENFGNKDQKTHARLISSGSFRCDYWQPPESDDEDDLIPYQPANFLKQAEEAKKKTYAEALKTGLQNEKG
jgi:hypothetical protein